MEVHTGPPLTTHDQLRFLQILAVRHCADAMPQTYGVKVVQYSFTKRRYCELSNQSWHCLPEGTQLTSHCPAVGCCTNMGQQWARLSRVSREHAPDPDKLKRRIWRYLHAPGPASLMFSYVSLTSSWGL